MPSPCESLPTLLRALRLSAMSQALESMEEQAQEQGWGFQRTLAALCEHELAERETRRIARYLKESRLPVAKTCATFDFTADKSLPKPAILAHAHDPHWVEQAENLLLFGPSGVGKTHLAAAIGHGLIGQGKRVLFTATTALVQRLQLEKKQLNLPQTLAKLDKVDLLILDDIGYVKKSHSESSVLFELIAHRYETGSMLITSNHPFKDWGPIFEDPIITVPAIDRLVHHATLVEISAQSYRKKSALRNMSKNQKPNRPF